MSRSLAVFSLLGVVVSAWLLWTFGATWSAFDKWNRTLAVMLLAAVWGCVAAAVATARQAFKRYPRTDVERPGEAGEAHGLVR